MLRALILSAILTLLLSQSASAENASDPVVPPPTDRHTGTASDSVDVVCQPGRHVIRRMSLPHCKRGPMRCPKCRAGEGTIVFCLIDIAPPQTGMVQRPVTKVLLDGVEVFREYDVIKVFASEAEARQYAETHRLTDCRWGE